MNVFDMMPPSINKQLTLLKFKTFIMIFINDDYNYIVIPLNDLIYNNMCVCMCLVPLITLDDGISCVYVSILYKYFLVVFSLIYLFLFCFV